MLNTNRMVWIASLAVLAGAFGAPRPAEAQVDLEGATRLAFNGTFASAAGGGAFGALNAGVSRVLDGGIEVGGDVAAIVSGGVTGVLSLRGGYNFIGESLTVPFVTAGFGTSLGG